VDTRHRIPSQIDKRFNRSAKLVACSLILLSTLIAVSPIKSKLQSDERKISQQQRTGVGLIAFYEFNEGSGKLVKDTSDVGRPVNLTFKTPKAVTWVDGGLEIAGKANIISNEEPKKLVEFPRRSGEMTLEAWIKPDKLAQKGPARIVSFSADANQRNFTLGQDGNKLDVRFRTTQTSVNGIPSAASPTSSLNNELTHFVYTRNRGGRVSIFINGKKVAQASVPGALNNWTATYKFALANEADKQRPWQGTLYLVAIYHRELPPNEISHNFLVSSTRSPEQAGDSKRASSSTSIPKAWMFTTRCFGSWV
jgi:hypothetical protein